jgi:hypothetical protein
MDNATDTTTGTKNQPPSRPSGQSQPQSTQGKPGNQGNPANQGNYGKPGTQQGSAKSSSATGGMVDDTNIDESDDTEEPVRDAGGGGAERANKR